MKQLVIDSCKRLVENDLIQRTWGNVSCRIDDKTFVITPSGRDYDSLTPDDIVVVNIEDLSYQGTVKPSSEKGVHGGIYALYPDVNFVVHTHQENASVLSVLHKDIPFDGGILPCAEFGLPGTKKLMNNVLTAAKRANKNAVLLSGHGVVCYGKDADQAFDIAIRLEQHCKQLVEQANLTNETAKQDAAKLVEFVKQIKGENVVFSDDEYVVSTSLSTNNVKPLLDDFAQIVGTSVKTVEKDDRNNIIEALKKNNAVLIKGVGMIAYGDTPQDAKAIEMITQKQCKAYLYASFEDKPHYIPFVYSLLMRFIYLKQYSKKIESNR